MSRSTSRCARACRPTSASTPQPSSSQGRTPAASRASSTRTTSVSSIGIRLCHGSRLRSPTVRRVLLLVSAIVLLDVLFYSAIAPLLPTYAEHLGLSKTQAGILSGSYALRTLLLAPPAGWLAAHRGTRPTLLVGL